MRKKFKLKPNMFKPLDDYEKELEESLERDEWVSVGNIEENRRRAAIIADNTLKAMAAKAKITTTVKALKDFIYKQTKKRVSDDAIYSEFEHTSSPMVAEKIAEYGVKGK